MIKKLLRQPIFLLGTGFILLMLGASFIHMFFFDSYVETTPFLYDEENNLKGAPFAPFDHSLLGTDSRGNHLVYYILMGAKFTILGVFAIAVLSFIGAFVIGIPLGFRHRTSAKMTENVISVLYFIPASLIAYNFLWPLLWEPFEDFQTSLAYRLFVQIMFISILLIPPAAILIANETSVILKKEFISSSRVLGGRPIHIFNRHLFPHIKRHLVLLITRQAIQALLVLTHLGVFKLFFGGTDVDYEGGSPPVPVTNDWASMIGQYYYTLQTHVPWIVGVPLIFLVLFVLSLLGITRGIKNVMESPFSLVLSEANPQVDKKKIIKELDPAKFTLIYGRNRGSELKKKQL